jgi:hypothetical protein
MIAEIFYAEPTISRDLEQLVSLAKAVSSHRVVSVESIINTACKNTMFVMRDDKGNIVASAVLVCVELAGMTRGLIEDVWVSPKFSRNSRISQKGRKMSKELQVRTILLCKIRWYAEQTGMGVDL